MKDEIKETLDELESLFEISEAPEHIINGFNKIRDYITNLQEQLHQASLDIQELTEKDIGCPSWCDKLTNLQEENKEWSMIFDTFSKRPYAHKYLEEKKKELGNKKIIGLDSEMIYKDYYDLKSRIDKAIEYVEKSMNNAHPFYEYICGDENGDVENLDKLLNILNGGDE